MAIDSPTITTQCSYCRELVPADLDECPRCGAPLEDHTPGGYYPAGALEELLEKSHQKLVDSGTSAAELAFGVGCTLGFLVGGFLILLIFFVITKVWTTLAIILVILILISLLISSILANRAREATVRSTFEREVKPSLEQFISETGLSQDKFNQQATEILPADSPLFLFSATQGDHSQQMNGVDHESAT